MLESKIFSAGFGYRGFELQRFTYTAIPY